MPSGSPEDQCRQVTIWVCRLMRHAGIEVVSFATAENPNPPLGLLDVPSKYVAIVDAMHQAMHALVLGEDLPKFTDPPAKSTKKRRR